MYGPPPFNPLRGVKRFYGRRENCMRVDSENGMFSVNVGR